MSRNPQNHQMKSQGSEMLDNYLEVTQLVSVRDLNSWLSDSKAHVLSSIAQRLRGPTSLLSVHSTYIQNPGG
jgi:hypothetical protein